MELYRGNNLLIQNFLLTSNRTFFSGRLFSSWLETWTRNESFEVLWIEHMGGMISLHILSLDHVV